MQAPKTEPVSDRDGNITPRWLQFLNTAFQPVDADLTAVAASGLASAWTTYTPTVTTGSGTITTLGTVSGRYVIIGKLTIVQVDVAITTNGTGAGNIQATLPNTSAANYYGAGREVASTGKELDTVTSGTKLILTAYDNSYPGGSGFRVQGSAVYEAA